MRHNKTFDTNLHHTKTYIGHEIFDYLKANKCLKLIINQSDQMVNFKLATKVRLYNIVGCQDI